MKYVVPVCFLAAAACGPNVQVAADGDPDATVSSDDGADASTTAAPPGIDESCPRLHRYPIALERGCDRIAVGDVDGDGLDDLVAVSGTGFIAQVDHSPVTVLHGAASGALVPEAHCCIDFVLGSFELTDLNRDGRDDLVHRWGVDMWRECSDIGTPPDTGMGAWLSGPLGGFVRPYTTGPVWAGGVEPSHYPQFVAHTDDEAVWVGFEYFTRLGWGAEGLTYDAEEWVAAGEQIVHAVLASFDGDDRAELVTAHPTRLVVWRASGPSFEPSTTLVLPSTDAESSQRRDFRLHVADIDADGDVDLLGVGVGGGVIVWRSDGAGSFDVPEALIDGLEPPLAIAGGPQPRLFAPVAGELLVFDPASPGTSGQALGPTGMYVEDLEVGDFDGDGTLDVAVCDELGVLLAFRGD